MKSPNTNNEYSDVIDINRGRVRYDDRVALARATGVLREEPSVATSEQQASSSEKRLLIGAAAATVAVGLAIAPQLGGNEAPKPYPASYVEIVEKSAQKPYDPEHDVLVIDGIRITPNSPTQRTLSGAVLSSDKVHAYMERHPDETTAIVTSANSVPGNAEEVGIVLRDVDGDGDTDAIVVQTK